MKKCQACGTENRAASLFCDECGTMLAAKGAPNNQLPNFRAQPSEMPVFQSSSATSVGIPSPQFEAAPRKVTFSIEEKTNGVHAALIIERGGLTGTKFALVSDETNIGRWDADNGIFPDVDMDKHDPEAKISRRHARIFRREAGKYFVEDLGSTNGTFINRGRRLIPGNENALGDGDEIIIGKTFPRFYVNR